MILLSRHNGHLLRSHAAAQVPKYVNANIKWTSVLRKKEFRPKKETTTHVVIFVSVEAARTTGITRSSFQSNHVSVSYLVQLGPNFFFFSVLAHLIRDKSASTQFGAYAAVREGGR
jgi:hypothetical protein